jgi:hypothetical protein
MAGFVFKLALSFCTLGSNREFIRFVIPAKAGIQSVAQFPCHHLDPGFRRGDGQ